jgi:transposase
MVTVAEQAPSSNDTSPAPGQIALLPEETLQAPAASSATVSPTPDPKIGARLREADRSQITWGRIDLDAQLPEDHPARAVWTVIERLDLSALYVQINARDQKAGTPAIDPKLLLALWVYATSEGEGSAREIARLCSLHAAYRWICGGVNVNYHTLSDFRSQQGAVLDTLITQVLALLMKANLIDLHRTAQDGMRVRAHAGAGSFRRAESLEALMTEARACLEEAADPALNARRRAAQRRAAQDRVRRLEAAMAEIPKVAETKKKSGAKDTTPRASTTDAEARIMKMGDGGFRPAFNVQFATTTDQARAIVGVAVTNRGSDMGESTPMLDQIESRTGTKPKEHLVDGGFPSHEAIDAAARKEVTLYAPLPKPRKGDTRDPHAPRDGDSPAVAAWRQRMATDAAKEIYRQRSATAETVNADAKQHRGLDQFPVRGTAKVLACALLTALTYNVLRLIALGA